MGTKVLEAPEVVQEEEEGEGRDFTDNEIDVANQVGQFILFCAKQSKGADIDPFAVIEAVRLAFLQLYEEFLKAQGLKGAPEAGAGE